MANTSVHVEQAIDRGYQIIAHHPSYSIPDRGSTIDAPYHDCSSFIGTCWLVPGRPSTHVMPSIYPQYGFDLYAYGSVTLIRGDILVMHRSAD